MLVPLLVLLVSLLVLSKASSWVIDNAVVLARFFRISEMAIGFLLVSFATSLPELGVALTGAFTRNTSISIGNVLGANISDMTLVIAIPALIAPIVIASRERKKLERIILAACVLPPLVLLQDSRIAGLLLLACFAAFAFFILREKVELEKNAEKIGRKRAFVAGVLLAVGFALIIASASVAVDSAMQLALTIGVSQAFIAATIISLGTTLPELSVSIAAAKKGAFGLAVGNALGSCVVNLALILGLTGTIASLQIGFVVFLNLLAFTLIAGGVLMRFVNRGGISKKSGFALLGVYVLFLLSALAVETLA